MSLTKKFIIRFTISVFASSPLVIATGCGGGGGAQCNSNDDCDLIPDSVCDTSVGDCEMADECGNGNREGGEDCDDGNDYNGDGCYDFCFWEPDYFCVEDENDLSLCIHDK